MSTTPLFFYFDLGNVLLNFDHEIACRQMAEVAGIATDRVREIVFESDLEWRYERGDISSQDFYESFCQLSGRQPDMDALKHAAAAIFELNEAVESIVLRLHRSGRQLGILSNTCEAHWEYVSDGRYELLDEPFSVYALSYELRSMKPEKKIYLAAAELAGFSPQEIFFVDDRPDNVQAALQAGFDAVQFIDADGLVAALLERNVVV